MVNSSTNSFSHSLNLVDLNDYLGPSQICIKPTQTASRIVDSNSSTYSNPKTEIRLDGHDLQNPPRSSSSSSQPSIEPPTTTLEKAQITLNDCLALDASLPPSRFWSLYNRPKKSSRSSIDQTDTLSYPSLPTL